MKFKRVLHLLYVVFGQMIHAILYFFAIYYFLVGKLTTAIVLILFSISQSLIEIQGRQSGIYRMMKQRQNPKGGKKEE